MSGLSFIGSYSGIDRSTIDQLMQVERLPLNQLNTRKTSITDQQNAWKDINTRLNTLFEKLKVLQSESTFTTNKATSLNEDFVTATADTSAVAGKYKINVQQLATNTSIIGGEINSEVFTNGGSFTIKSADNSVGREVNFAPNSDLRSLVAEINEVSVDQVDSETKEVIKKGTGVTAAIIDGRIVLTDEKTGDRTIELSGDNNTLKNLGLSNIGVDTKKEDGARLVDGKNAVFTINGMEIEKRSNSIDDVVEGLTINLKKEGETVVTIGTDNEKAETAIKEFVDQYNSTMKFIEGKLAAGDPEVPGSAGTLSGDGTLMRLHSSLRSLVTASIKDEEGGFTDISQLGVSTKDRYGELQLDATKFSKALLEDPSKVAKFFGSDENSGYAAGMRKQIDSFISDKNGIIKTKNESFDMTLKDINRRIEDFEVRMVKREERLIKQFTALDVAMMQAESQMSWLAGQVNAMNGVKN
ncbi:MAG: flagellar filament capping protein FliD [Tissierella sp.]|nr:flagellar filament capping protein FliD [Tissierella sp.]